MRLRTRWTTLVGITSLTLAAATAQAAGSGAVGATGRAHNHARMGTVHVTALSVGHVLVDAAGRTVYVFSSDKHHRPTCANACEGIWPPLLVDHLHAGSGVKKRWLGTVKTAGGERQVTYHHWPLYTYVGDTKAGEATGQGIREFGGTWSTIAANARTDFGGAAAPPSSTGGSGGYGYGASEPSSNPTTEAAAATSSSGTPPAREGSPSTTVKPSAPMPEASPSTNPTATAPPSAAGSPSGSGPSTTGGNTSGSGGSGGGW
jgi:predicted lipoprotein with Yx(FWY)xxD motif